MTRVKFMVLVTSMVVVVVGSPVRAAYVGLSTTATGINIDGTDWGVIRVYASFTDPNDYANAVYGNAVSSLSIRNTTNDGVTPGSGFFNPGGFGSNRAPYLDEIAFNPNLAHGTFATIGVSIADQGSGALPSPPDETNVSVGFPNFISGHTLTNNNFAWFTPGPVEQGRAGYLGDGDPQLRVMLMQLTVHSGELVIGTINLAVSNSTGQTFNVFNQSFFAQAPFPAPPTPGTLGVLCLAAIIGPQRRRKY